MSKHPLALPRLCSVAVREADMNVREVDPFRKLRSHLSGELPEQWFLLNASRTAVSRYRGHIYDS